MSLVLVVEDDPANAMRVEAVLTRIGHQVLLATDGPDAIDVAARRRPDLALVNISLAGSMTGAQVCRALRADPATAGIPVLMLSTWAPRAGHSRPKPGKEVWPAGRPSAMVIAWMVGLVEFAALTAASVWTPGRAWWMPGTFAACAVLCMGNLIREIKNPGPGSERVRPSDP